MYFWLHGKKKEKKKSHLHHWCYLYATEIICALVDIKRRAGKVLFSSDEKVKESHTRCSGVLGIEMERHLSSSSLKSTWQKNFCFLVSHFLYMPQKWDPWLVKQREISCSLLYEAVISSKLKTVKIKIKAKGKTEMWRTPECKFWN